ncbi:MAG: hypothetical protein H6822_09425 [Planctomycetaceae bacterium]|nr:hypothetical protein [Planctomycetales bacterium]MCB9922392.1 hypothetical protein [Planctomycetaceae bacterium]
MEKLSLLQRTKHRPLQVAVARGMPVCEMGDGTPGSIVGFTDGYCIYRLDDGETLCVAPWRGIALSNICPASTLLPADVSENDRQNASATVLRELLSLHRIAKLTPAQQTTSEELLELLCGI